MDGAGDVNRVCSLLAEHRVLSVSGNHDRWMLEGSMRELPDATAICALRECTRLAYGLPNFPKRAHSKHQEEIYCYVTDSTRTTWRRSGLAKRGLVSNLTLRFMSWSHRNLPHLVINGHTHLPMVRTVGQLTIINAGTLDRRSRPVCSVIDFDRGKVEFFDIGLDRISSAECFALPRTQAVG